MTESTTPVVHRILDKLAADVAESVGSLEGSLTGLTLRPTQHGGSGASVADFIADVVELGALDASLGWLGAVFNTAASTIAAQPVAELVWGSDPKSLAATALDGKGAVRRNRLTGSWRVVGAEYADWFLLPAKGCRVLTPRSAVQVDPGHGGLTAAGIGDVAVTNWPVDDGLVLDGEDVNPLAAVGAAAAVVGSADGVWRRHVGQVRARLATTYGGEDVAHEASAQVAWAASDIDAARLQVSGALNGRTWACRQAVSRARAAADRLMAISKNALDAADPVTLQWQDLQAGCRLAERIFAKT